MLERVISDNQDATEQQVSSDSFRRIEDPSPLRRALRKHFESYPGLVETRTPSTEKEVA